MPVLLSNALILFSLLTALWLLSLVLKNASLVDIFWGLGFLLIEGLTLTSLGFEKLSPRALILFLLVLIWSLRLSGFLFLRNGIKKEDYRYQQMRKNLDPGFAWKSLFTVFYLQGSLIWFISLPLYFGTISTERGLCLGDGIGILLWGIGFIFEAVGDFQLARFKKNPANQGKVLDTGLWQYTRHPNYFGEAVLWWGYALIGFSASGNFWVLGSALLMNFLLMKVSGVTLLEKTLVHTKPQYTDYIKKTPAFFPKFKNPRR